MVKISQTDYIDFLTRAGVYKVSKVKTIFNRPEYHPAFDFYKEIREEFTSYLKLRKSKDELFVFLNDQSPKKQPRFQLLIKGYLKYLGKKDAAWFNPPNENWIYKDLSIKLNPEIGIQIDNEKFIVKLYFKDSRLKPNEIKVLLWMMESTLCTGIYSGYRCALLDIEKSKLHYFKKTEPLIMDLIEGEADTFLRLWRTLEKQSA